MAAKSPEPASRLPIALLTAGLVTLLVSAAFSRLPVPFVRELTLVAGTGLMLAGVIRRLKEAGWDFRDRVETAAYVSTAGAVAAAMAMAGLNETWGAARLFYAAASLFAFGATLLVLLPSVPRKVVLSLWILFHFGGMFTSFSSIDPPGSQGPFLSKQLWTFVYRPYLSFLYMTNAYHFYSPDPGPPVLMWFAVHYTDGSYSWVKLPNRDTPGQISMHYQRLLALPEHSFTQNTFVDPARWDAIYERRVKGSAARYAAQGRHIPLVSDLRLDVQYREPNDTSKLLIASIAKRVAAHLAPKRDGAEVRSVKVYRVVHQILTPYEMAKKADPYEKVKHWPYFLGEFTPDGEPVDPGDPFLYWYIPIVYVPTAYPNHGQRDPKSGAPILAVQVAAANPNYLLDGLEMHAAGPAKEKK